MVRQIWSCPLVAHLKARGEHYCLVRLASHRRVTRRQAICVSLQRVAKASETIFQLAPEL